MLTRFVRALYGFLTPGVLSIADAIRKAEIVAFVSAFDTQAQPGTLKLYDGTRPAKNGTPPAPGTPLSTINLKKPAFDTTSTALGVAALIVTGGVSDPSAGRGGTATWARFADGGGNFIADCDVGAGKEITLDSYVISAGGTVNLTSGSFTAGNP